MAGWEYTGDDNASATDTQRDVVSARINQAFARLGSGWMLHVDVGRSPVEAYSARRLSHFPDRVSAAIDEERRAYFAQPGAAYQSRCVLCVTYMPPSGATKRLAEVMYEDDATTGDKRLEATQTLALFQNQLDALENRLSSSLRLRRLGARTEYTEDGQEVVYDDVSAICSIV